MAREDFKHKLTAIICFIVIAHLLSCARPPRTNRFGLAQHNYVYRIPEKTDDGWETSSLSTENVNSKKINELILDILNGKFKNIYSILLVKNGKVILEEYFYGYNRDSIFDLQSALKSVVSILVGIAIDQQMISSLDQKVYDFYPEFKKTNWVEQKNNITIKHALTMTAGLEWDQLTSDVSRNDGAKLWQSKNRLRYLMEKKLVEPPGTKFNYSSGLSILLGGIIKETTGNYCYQFAEKNLFQPLSISNYQWDLGQWRIDVGGTVGKLFLNPRDMAKIGYLMLKEGNWHGKQIVSRQWAIESTKPHITDDLFGAGYGYQWWCGNEVINGHNIDAYYAAGHGGQYIFIVPKLDLVAAFTSKVNDNPLGMYRLQAIMINSIIPAMLSQSQPQKIAKIDQLTPKKYEGKFRITGYDEILTIIRKENTLFCKLFGNKFELIHSANHQFYGQLKNIGEVKIDFHTDSQNDIESLEVKIGFIRLPFTEMN